MASSKILTGQITAFISRKHDYESSSINISHTGGKVHDEAFKVIISNCVFAIDIRRGNTCILSHQMARDFNLQVIANNLAQYGDIRKLAIQITWDYETDLPATRVDRNLKAAANHIESLMEKVRYVLVCFKDLEHITVTFSTSPETRPWNLPGAIRVHDFLRPLEFYKLGRPSTTIVVQNLWKITGQRLQKGEIECKTLSESVIALAYLSIRQVVWRH